MAIMIKGGAMWTYIIYIRLVRSGSYFAVHFMMSDLITCNFPQTF